MKFSLRSDEYDSNMYWQCDGCDNKGYVKDVLARNRAKSVKVDEVELIRNAEKSHDTVHIGNAGFDTSLTNSHSKVNTNRNLASDSKSYNPVATLADAESFADPEGKQTFLETESTAAAV